MTKLVLTRHGHVEGIDPPRFRGRAELELTDLGHAEARAVASRIARDWSPRAIYTSPMGRCRATATHIAEACGTETIVSEGLNDLDYGAWQGHSHDEIRERFPDQFSAWFATPQLVRFPDGESLQDLIARTADMLRLVVERHPDQGDTVVLVGHDSVNRALLLQLLDMPIATYWRITQTPCTINEIDIKGDRVRALRINETGHLEGVSLGA
ncbi:MAG: histidine phosphatase family protein [Pseudomonadota bacterium]